MRGSGRFPSTRRLGPRFGRRSQSPSLRGSGRFHAEEERARQEAAGLNPLHCGAVVASRGHDAAARAAAHGSQSPSLRGSGRFVVRIDGPRGGGRGLNPLHCGAVVASIKGGEMTLSNPCLNPLHCGAVVASGVTQLGWRLEEGVSIPFIAGQWSLPTKRSKRFMVTPSLNPLHCGAVVASRRRARRPRWKRASLNPLHCGAVVASKAGSSGAGRGRRSQSPSLRGSGRFGRRGGGAAGGHRVSIPFIAGQWSLHIYTLD